MLKRLRIICDLKKNMPAVIGSADEFLAAARRGWRGVSISSSIAQRKAITTECEVPRSHKRSSS